eukprot:scaffold12829_cov176-Skeletonema_menzelii.AAC.2
MRRHHHDPSDGAGQYLVAASTAIVRQTEEELDSSNRSSFDGEMDVSSRSSSSFGRESNFIQQRIDKHKRRGSWFNNSSDDDSQCDEDNQHENAKNNENVKNTMTVVKSGEYPGENEQPAMSVRMPRTPSLVCMLKMEPIGEKEVFKKGWNGEEEVEAISHETRSYVSGIDSDAREIDDKGAPDPPDNEDVKSSFVSDVSGIDSDAGFEIGDMAAPDPPIDEGEIRRRRPSFLPNIESERFVEVEVTPMVDANRVKSREGGDCSEDTFTFTSINSADNITHASDAPDYDYNSKRGEQNKSTKNEERSTAASAPYKQKFISPMERQRLSQERAQNTAQNEVCEVLGLPKNTPRKVHRGIMSRDTEVRLRDLIEDEADSALNPHVNPSFNQNERSASKLQWGEGTDSTVDSNDSSEDFVFGDLPEKRSKENDKWERLVHERRSSRRSFASNASSQNITKHAHKNETDSPQAEESHEIPEKSWHNSFRWIKNLPHNVSKPDDEG